MPKRNMEELKDKIRLQEYSYNDSEDESITDISLPKYKGDYNPPRNRDIVLDTLSDFMAKFPIEELKTSTKKPNINSKE